MLTRNTNYLKNKLYIKFAIVNGFARDNVIPTAHYINIQINVLSWTWSSLMVI